MGEAGLVNGSALVDAGYEGKLTYLIMLDQDITLKPGDKVANLLRINVTATKEIYHGQWK